MKKIHPEDAKECRQEKHSQRKEEMAEGAENQFLDFLSDPLRAWLFFVSSW